jgi:hypothetical protein
MPGAFRIQFIMAAWGDDIARLAAIDDAAHTLLCSETPGYGATVASRLRPLTGRSSGRPQRAAKGRFDPFAKPSANDRCLREADSADALKALWPTVRIMSSVENEWADSRPALN